MTFSRLCCLSFFALQLRAAPPPISAPAQQLPVFPSLPTTAHFAEQHGFSLNEIAPSQDSALAAGDFAVLQVSLNSKDGVQQWLVTLKVSELTPEERSKKVPDLILYLSSGNHFAYPFRPVGIDLATYGPFSQKKSEPSEPPQKAHILVNEENLAIGFDRCCRALLRVSEAKKMQGDATLFTLSARSWPFSTADVAATKAGSKNSFTPPEEKSFAGALPALMSFFDLAKNTAGVREILQRVIDLPSAWSIIKHGGQIQPDIRFSNAIGRVTNGLGSGEHFLFPMTLSFNQQIAAQCILIVTEARRPLLTTAGIERLYMQSPSRPEQIACIQVMSTSIGSSQAQQVAAR